MKVLIVDPDIVGSRYLSFVFAAQGYDDLISVSGGKDALERVTNDEYGLVIAEADLPDSDGASLCRALRSRSYHGPIIVMSERSAVSDRIRAFEAGADDCIEKPIDPSELLARVSAVSSRYNHEDQHPIGRTLCVGDVELSIRDMSITLSGREPVRLTPTEMRLMECLMRNADVAISRETLVNRTWGFDIFGDSNRLDVYVRRLRHKIERDPTTPRYLVTVRTVGYAFRSVEQAIRPDPDEQPLEWVETAQLEPHPAPSLVDSVFSDGQSPEVFSDEANLEVLTG